MLEEPEEAHLASSRTVPLDGTDFEPCHAVGKLPHISFAPLPFGSSSSTPSELIAIPSKPKGASEQPGPIYQRPLTEHRSHGDSQRHDDRLQSQESELPAAELCGLDYGWRLMLAEGVEQIGRVAQDPDRYTLASFPSTDLLQEHDSFGSTVGLAGPAARSAAGGSRFARGKTRIPISCLASLDSILIYREQVAEVRRVWCLDSARQSKSSLYSGEKIDDDFESPRQSGVVSASQYTSISSITTLDGSQTIDGTAGGPSPTARQSRFRSLVAEVGFCFTISTTQFLTEYLITGFAIELPNLIANQAASGESSVGGNFWPATLLSLVLSAMLLAFARLSDMYSGYGIFMFGVGWLTLWTLLPGIFQSAIMLDVSRAMQGLALAACTPSTFTMIGSVYAEGPRRNFVMGIYSGCAPLGFFAGFLVAGALPPDQSQWYFWIASILSFATLAAAYLCIPVDRTDRQKLNLRMDWLGAFLITAGLILVAYALAFYPYANQIDPSRDGFTDPTVLATLVVGIACLCMAVWVEGWVAHCPLLPFDFFKPRGVIAFCLAGLCFYAAYGVWLYTSAEFFQSPTGTTTSASGVHGITLAVWYVPTAAAGLILCLIGGALIHIVPIKVLLLLSGLAWIGAPLLLAVGPLPLDYWELVLPSMLCATIGIDLTFTISIIFLSSSQPQKFQGLSGAVSSVLVNLAMSFSLSISEIVRKKTENSPPNALTPPSHAQRTNWGLQTMLMYGAASAAMGFFICVFFVKISRNVMRERPTDEDGGLKNPDREKLPSQPV